LLRGDKGSFFLDERPLSRFAKVEKENFGKRPRVLTERKRKQGSEKKRVKLFCRDSKEESV